MKHKLLFLTFISVAVLATLHFIASAFYFYWTLGWFDNLMHFLGGFSIGLLSLWFYFHSGIIKKLVPNQKQAILKSLFFVIVIGVGWEVFEYLNGLTQSTESYPLDVIHDLIADSVGAIVAGDLASRKKLYE